MFFLKKRIEVAGSHRLALNYPSKCANMHGHNWIITVYCKSKTLDANGMVEDFGHIKQKVMELDHQCLNDILPFNPTAENIAEYLCKTVSPSCYRVDVIESENNEASYVKEDAE